MRPRKSNEFGIRRRVTWDEHCTPTFWFGVILFAVLGSVFSIAALYWDGPGGGPEDAKFIFLLFLGVIIWFIFATKRANENGELLTEVEIALLEKAEEMDLDYDHLVDEYIKSIER